MAFESDVVVREVADATWELAEPLRYAGHTDRFVVPAGFRTDFASVPRAFVWLIPKYGRYTKAAILHDFLCAESKNGRFDRDDADGLFRRAMRELGVPFLRRWLMWAAVSVATQWTKVRRTRRVSAKRIAQLLVIAIPSVVFFALPAVVVTVWLALFWLLEGIAFLALKPFSRKPVNPPRFTWRTS
jgi:Protein of unknown function (DUF1353)